MYFCNKSLLIFSLLLFFLLLPLLSFSQEREKMIIVSPTLFSTQLNEYIAAKEADNIDCRILIADSVESFQTIKQKITDMHVEFCADFLLLIGDFEHIPSYVIEEGLSDMQYGILSENDSLPEMIVGRFSVETAEHLQTMIQRSLEYKNCSKTVVGIASKQRSGLTQLTDFEQVSKMNDFLEIKGFHIESELFEGTNGSSPTEKDIIQVLNQGVTWVNYAGNGFYQGWNTSGFSNNHIDSLSNSEELPIIFSAACLNGHFANKECFAEKWVRSTSNGNPAGARAVVMSSTLTDWDATLLAMLQICEKFPSDINFRLGALYRQAYSFIINELRQKKDAKCWLLFGDPTLWIYPPIEAKINESDLIAQPNFLYPNPTTGELTINNKELIINNIEIFDMLGKKLSTFNFQLSTIDISHLQTGIYFVKIQTDIGTITKKITKQ